jgi:hypothetical protein
MKNPIAAAHLTARGLSEQRPKMLEAYKVLDDLVK